MIVELLPRQVDMFVARQTVECSGFDGMNDLLRRSLCGNEIEPPPGGKLCGIQTQDVFSNGITAPKAIEQPPVEFVLLQCFLQRFNVCFDHLKNYMG